MARPVTRFAQPETSEARTVLCCLIALLTVVAIGTTGFMLIQPEWGIWKSFFFTLVTITTVGYGDEGLTEEGQAFAAVLLLVGIGTATYSLSAIVRVALQFQLSWKLKMREKIKNLKDHFVICGFGRIGETVCDEIAKAGVPFVVIEQNEDACRDAIESGYFTIQGNSTEDEVLQLSGVAHARGVICVIDNDAENVFITLCVRELNPSAYIAARANARASINRLKRAGASLVISPYTAAGLTIAGELLKDDPNRDASIVSKECEELWEQACEAVLEEPVPTA